MKLKLLKIFFQVIFNVAWKMTGRQRFSHIIHYLNGSGKAITLGQEHRAYFKTIVAVGLSINNDNRLPILSSMQKGVRIGWHHSTLYSGAGFAGRPELFYMIGGFSFDVVRNHNIYICSGTDRYDWHCNGVNEDGTEIWFSSPIGMGRIGQVIIKTMAFIFGKEYFTEGENSVTGESGISNKLWHDLQMVGAKEFNTKWSFTFGVNEIDQVAGQLQDGGCIPSEWSSNWRPEKVESGYSAFSHKIEDMKYSLEWEKLCPYWEKYGHL